MLSLIWTLSIAGAVAPVEVAGVVALSSKPLATGTGLTTAPFFVELIEKGNVITGLINENDGPGGTSYGD
jgi:hypothetical protein